MTSHRKKQIFPFPILGLAVIFLFIGFVFSLPDAASNETQFGEQEARGKQIYVRGKGTHPISAYLSGPGFKEPADRFPCIQCHLEDGRGSREGGIQAPDITFENLSLPENEERATGRSHPPYNNELLEKAIQHGLDPAGNSLHPAMPRYIMEKQDMEDLIAYLRVIGHDPVPGVTEDMIRVGTLLPDTGPLAKASGVVEKLLSTYFENLNRRGGMYGRKLKLVSVFFDPSNPHSALEALTHQLDEDPVFCFIANLGLLPGSEAVRLLEEKQVPSLVPLTITPYIPVPLDSRTFYLYSSIFDQARVLVDYLKENKPDRKIGLVYADEPFGKDGAAGVRAQSRRYDLSIATEQAYPGGRFNAAETVKTLKEAEALSVLFFGDGSDLRALVLEADRQGWRPEVFSIMELSGIPGASLPKRLANRVLLASPAGPSPNQSKRRELFYNLIQKAQTGNGYMAFQTSAFAGAVLLEEGLKLAGRQITRGRLVKKIGNLWKLETGVSPALIYSDNRRTGSIGASIAGVDKKTGRLVLVRDWQEPR